MKQLLLGLQQRLFQLTCLGVFFLFVGIMAWVAFVAGSRQSGNTGIDAARIPSLRQRGHAELEAKLNEGEAASRPLPSVDGA